MRGRSQLTLAVLACAALAVPALATAGPKREAKAGPQAREIGSDLRAGKPLPVPRAGKKALMRRGGASTLRRMNAAAAAETPPVGTTRPWIAYDDVNGLYRPGDHPRGDDPVRTDHLSMETMWDTEPAYDSGFVQISIDGGQTWTSLGNDETTDELDAGADPVLVNNLPGFNGSSGGWRHEEFDVSAWAGQTVLLLFRYVTDVNTGGDGWWVDDVRLNGTLVTDGTSLAGWQSATQLNPIPIEGFTVQLISYTDDHRRASIAELRLRDGRDGCGLLGASEGPCSSSSTRPRPSRRS